MNASSRPSSPARREAPRKVGRRSRRPSTRISATTQRRSSECSIAPTGSSTPQQMALARSGREPPAPERRAAHAGRAELSGEESGVSRRRQSDATRMVHTADGTPHHGVCPHGDHLAVSSVSRRLSHSPRHCFHPGYPRRDLVHGVRRFRPRGVTASGRRLMISGRSGWPRMRWKKPTARHRPPNRPRPPVVPRDAAVASRADHRRPGPRHARHRPGRLDHHLAALGRRRLGRRAAGRRASRDPRLPAVLRRSGPARRPDPRRRGGHARRRLELPRSRPDGRPHARRGALVRKARRDRPSRSS